MLGEIGEIQKALKEMNVEMLPKKAKIFYVVVHITEIREYRYVIAAEDKEKYLSDLIDEVYRDD